MSHPHHTLCLLTALVATVSLSGCANPPALPEPQGERQYINTSDLSQVSEASTNIEVDQDANAVKNNLPALLQSVPSAAQDSTTQSLPQSQQKASSDQIPDISPNTPLSVALSDPHKTMIAALHSNMGGAR